MLFPYRVDIGRYVTCEQELRKLCNPENIVRWTCSMFGITQAILDSMNLAVWVGSWTETVQRKFPLHWSVQIIISCMWGGV